MIVISKGVYPDGIKWDIVRYDIKRFVNCRLYELRVFSVDFGVWYVVASHRDVSVIKAVHKSIEQKGGIL